MVIYLNRQWAAIFSSEVVCTKSANIVPGASQFVYPGSAMNSSSSASVTAKGFLDASPRAEAFSRRSSTALGCEPLIQNHSNFKRSSPPARLMFYENGSWVNYSEEVVDLLKLGFAEGKPMVEAQVLGSNCLFDLYRMLEIDLESGNQRSIAWIGVDGKCFFPKTFVDSRGIARDVDLVDDDQRVPKIEIDVKIVENTGNDEDVGLNMDVKLGKRGRNENVKEKMDESFCAVSAKRLKTVGSESRWPKARNLAAEEKCYIIVRDLILSRLGIVDPGATITSIHQYLRMGLMDKARSEVFAKQIEITKRARGESNIVFAWYGTSAQGVESILMHGFGIPSNSSCSRSRSRSPGYGKGIHLSPVRLPQNSAMLSEVDENGEKHVLLCRVILGKCEKVEAGSHQYYPSSVEYDTGVDDLINPRWYTVWRCNMNTHILPECVVSYRPVNLTGFVNRLSKNWVPHPSAFIAKLFSKLKGSLPSPRFSELQTSWESCKEGKLEKNAFMKKLHLLVGDDALRSVIQEIRG